MIVYQGKTRKKEFGPRLELVSARLIKDGSVVPDPKGNVRVPREKAAAGRPRQETKQATAVKLVSQMPEDIKTEMMKLRQSADRDGPGSEAFERYARFCCNYSASAVLGNSSKSQQEYWQLLQRLKQVWGLATD